MLCKEVRGLSAIAFWCFFPWIKIHAHAFACLLSCVAVFRYMIFSTPWHHFIHHGNGSFLAFGFPSNLGLSPASQDSGVVGLIVSICHAFRGRPTASGQHLSDFKDSHTVVWTDLVSGFPGFLWFLGLVPRVCQSLPDWFAVPSGLRSLPCQELGCQSHYAFGFCTLCLLG